MPTTPSTPPDTPPAWNSCLPRRDEIVPGGRRYTFTYKGDWFTLQEAFNSLKVGLTQEFLDLTGTVCSGRIDRAPGDRSTATVVFVHPENVEYWALGHTEIQKPVKTWKANDEEDPPNLMQISRWEGLQASDWASYCAYLWDGVAAMTGNTLKLAKMIHEWGISYYSIAAPVVVRSTTWASWPEEAGVGLYKECQELANRSGWIDTGSADVIIPTKLNELANVWFKTKDDVTPNADGTFSRVEQWLGADAINKDLYPDDPPKEGDAA